jgi:hypothetical protein
MKSIALAVIPLSVLASAAFAATAPDAGAAMQHRVAAHHEARSPNTPEARRITRALNLIEAKGYGDFENFHAAGRDYDATVTRDGKPVTLTVDPDSGRVTLKG